MGAQASAPLDGSGQVTGTTVGNTNSTDDAWLHLDFPHAECSGVVVLKA